MAKGKKTALFGGTFDPIHSGHIETALLLAEALSVDEVILMPTSVPPHKLRAQMASGADRLAMCRLAAAPYPKLTVSDLELRRGGASFTADTLAMLEKERPEDEWYLFTGADMFCTLRTWYHFPDIARRAVLCTVPRDGVDAARLRAYADALTADGARCYVARQAVTPVSSTEIRPRAAAGQPLRLEAERRIVQRNSHQKCRRYVHKRVLLQKQGGQDDGHRQHAHPKLHPAAGAQSLTAANGDPAAQRVEHVQAGQHIGGGVNAPQKVDRTHKHVFAAQVNRPQVQGVGENGADDQKQRHARRQEAHQPVKALHIPEEEPGKGHGDKAEPHEVGHNEIFAERNVGVQRGVQKVIAAAGGMLQPIKADQVQRKVAQRPDLPMR